MTDFSNIEDFMLHVYWSNDWVSSAYCSMCGCLFDPDTTRNVYRVKNDFYCEEDYFEIQQQHMKRNVKWFGDLYFESVKESSDLQ